jgi:hypothetical protein
MSKDNFSFIDEADKWLDAAYARGQLSGVDGKKPRINDLKQELRKAVLEGFKAAMLEKLEGLEIDVEATKERLEEIYGEGDPRVNVEIEASDRHAVLDDVRVALETLVKGKGDL